MAAGAQLQKRPPFYAPHLQPSEEDPQINPETARTVMEAIYNYHREYQTRPADIRTDTQFILSACCCVLAVLFAKPI